MKKKSYIGYLVLPILLGLLFLLSDNSRVQQRLLRPALMSVVEKQGLHLQIDSLRWHWLNARLELYDVVLKDAAESLSIRAQQAVADFRLVDLLWRQCHIQSLRVQALNADAKFSQPVDSARVPHSSSKKPWQLKLDHCLLSDASAFGYFDLKNIDIHSLKAKMALQLHPQHQYLRLEDLSFEEMGGFRMLDLDLQASLLHGNELHVDKLNFSLPHSFFYADTLQLRMNAWKADSIQLLREFQWQAQLSVLDFPTLHARLQANQLTATQAYVRMRAHGDAQTLYIPELDIRAEQLLSLQGNFTLNELAKTSRSVQSDYVDCMLHPDVALYYKALFPGQQFELPVFINNLGTSSYKGNFAYSPQSIRANGDAMTQKGTLGIMAEFYRHSSEDYFDGQASVQLESCYLGDILEQELLSGTSSLDVKMDVQNAGSPTQALDLQAQIHQLTLYQYPYRQVFVKAQSKAEDWSLQVYSDDPNCRFHASAQSTALSSGKDYQAQMSVQHANLQAINVLPGEEELAHLSFDMQAHFQEDDSRRWGGEMRIDSLDLYHHQTKYFLPSFVLNNDIDGEYAHLQILSDQINADVYGDMRWKELYQELKTQVLAYYLPSLMHDRPTTLSDANDNQFAFRVEIASTDSLAKAFSWPLSIQHQAHIEGYFYDEKDVFALSVLTDSLRAQQHLLQDVALLIDNKNREKMQCSLSADYPSAEELFSFQLNADVAQDEVNMGINILLDKQKEFAHSNSRHLFAKDSMGKVTCYSNVHIPYIQWKDALWQLDTTAIDYRSQKFYVKDFVFHNEQQFLSMEGCISSSSSDTLLLKASAINLEHLLQLLLKKTQIAKPMLFGGDIYADANLRSLLSEPQIDADLQLKDFSINKAVLGDLQASARWQHEQSCLMLHSYVNKGDMRSGELSGAYYIRQDSLLLDIHSEGLPLNFISYYLEPWLQLNATSYGWINIIGAPKRNLWDATAHAFVPDGELFSPFTNTRYTFSDSLRLTPGKIHLDHITFYDEYHHAAQLDGTIAHQNFLRMFFDLNLDMQALHLMNLPSSEQAFYGEVELSGNAKMSGPDNNIQLDLDVKTEDHTNFYLSMAETATQSNYSFIEFAPDKNELNLEYETKDTPKKRQTAADGQQSFYMAVDMELEITPLANLVFVLNSATGDEMRMSGNGNLRLSYDQKDDLQLFGRYELDKGKFGFTLQDLLHRDFNILEGSSINFSGDLMSAEMDINANYSILNVELSSILDEAEISSMNLNRTSIPVNCEMDISGDLQQPEIILGLDFPSADEELRRRILNVLNTDEILNRQIVYLLIFNRFTVTENVQNADVANNNMSAVLDLGLNSLSNQLNRYIYQALGSDNLALDLNYRYDDMAEGLGEWQVAMTGQLLNNRLTVNGNIGSREDLVNDNTQFIGDFDLEYKFSRDGRLRGKVYNRTNDSRYFKSAMTTQGIGLVYKESFNTLSELRQNFVNWLARMIKQSKAEADFPLKNKPSSKKQAAR